MNCHNGEKYLSDSLQSIINQKYKNWELIFWDNCSIDNSRVIFKSFSEKRFRYFYSSKYTTLYKARNKAITKAKGQYISFCDTDDMWIDNKLELQIRKFKNKKIGLVYSNYIIQNDIINKKKVFSKNILPEGDLKNLILKEYKIGILTVILRRYFFTKEKFFFNNNYNIIGDFDLFLRLQRVTKFACVQQPLAIYRIHKNNFSIKNYNLYIAELENWLKSQKILKHNQQVNFIIDKINYMKVMLQIYKGSKINALFRMSESPFSLNKIKLLIMLLVPLFILKRIKDIN
jgi:glycosyltransferase involved in cell wall biosynthesis